MGRTFSPLWMQARGTRLSGVCVLAALLTSSCATPAIVRTARDGNIDALRRLIAEESKAGRLDERRTRQIAEGMLEGEIARSRGPDGAAFVASLRACAEPLEDALDDRAKTRDAVGGEAALILVERNAWCRPSPRSFANDEDGAWRALAAESADSHSDAAWRRKFLEDKDERVRRAAANAASRARDEKDVEVLLDAGRLDPDPLTRSRALRAAGAIGGARVASALRDRFAVAEEADRMAIVEGWAEPATFEAGGRQQLEYVAHQTSGMVAIAAASALLRASSSRNERTASEEEAFARLAHASRDGSQSERRLALQLLPSEHPGTEELLLAASRDADPQVSLLATVRLAGWPAHESKAEKRLRAWATSASPLRMQARAALAVYGSPEVLKLLVQGKSSKDPEERRLAGHSLIRLGAITKAATLLGDARPEVRQSVACRMLSDLPAAPRSGL